MSHQITLTDDEYEALVREALAERFPSIRSNSPQVRDALIEAMWRAGHLSSVPTRIPDTPEEAEERERLSKTIAPGKLASEIVIEDRGPR